jgi:hypothetical protein
VLVADRTWEEGRVGAPAIVAEGDTLVMFYAGGDRDRPRRLDRRRPDLDQVAGAGPDRRDLAGVAYDGATWLLAFVDGRRRDRPGPLRRRPRVHPAAAPILTARADDPDAFDHAAVARRRWPGSSRAPAAATGRCGTPALRKPPARTDAPLYAIGYAASWDGASWSPLAGNRPVAAAPAGDPAVLLDGNHGVMAFAAVNGRSQVAIGLAITRVALIARVPGATGRTGSALGDPRPTVVRSLARRAAMKVRFWGVRGSIPVPGPSTNRYGGNTSCVEVRPRGAWPIIIDAGTGIRRLGKALMDERFGEGAAPRTS